MRNNVLTKYLAVFLLICLVSDGILLCFCADKPWWNNWMIMAPNLFMVLGAFYCHMMKKNVDEQPNRLTWLLFYKGIKLLFAIALLALYIIFVGESSRAFVAVMATAYLISLVAETGIYNHYIKKLNKENKA